MASSLASEPARLDRGSRDEPSAGAVGLGIDLQLAGAGEECGGAESDAELASGGGQLDRAAVQRPDARVLGPKSCGGFRGDLVVSGAGLELEVETEPADHVVQLVVAQPELLGEVR